MLSGFYQLSPSHIALFLYCFCCFRRHPVHPGLGGGGRQAKVHDDSGSDSDGGSDDGDDVRSYADGEGTVDNELESGLDEDAFKLDELAKAAILNSNDVDDSGADGQMDTRKASQQGGASAGSQKPAATRATPCPRDNSRREPIDGPQRNAKVLPSSPSHGVAAPQLHASKCLIFAQHR